MIISSKFAGRIGTVEANVYQRTVDYPEEWANGFHVLLDIQNLVTVRWGQVESLTTFGLVQEHQFLLFF